MLQAGFLRRIDFPAQIEPIASLATDVCCHERCCNDSYPPHRSCLSVARMNRSPTTEISALIGSGLEAHHRGHTVVAQEVHIRCHLVTWRKTLGGHHHPKVGGPSLFGWRPSPLGWRPLLLRYHQLKGQASTERANTTGDVVRPNIPRWRFTPRRCAFVGSWTL